ncbi:ATP-binding protein [Candidatus Babeliales bacterium]|nr:ATP-binding protein [Candidatus Babeliales bacterium]MCF7899289.1 ATP-binding protein [Candidatus Babeliales bacterium]
MFKRYLEKKILDALEYSPIILLRGARQTGKTTLAKVISAEKNYNYLTFDNLTTLVAAKNDPISFISRSEKPIILDEIQRVPELFLPIKSDVDENRIPGRYFLTGSADPLLIPKLGDSLAGRMRLLTLWPLSQGEIEGKKEHFLNDLFEKKELVIGQKIDCSKKNILNRALKGGYPTSLNLTDRQRSEWFNDYISLVLQKDILDLSKIENVTQMPNLLTLLASRVGGILNTEELARSIKLSGVTLHRYLDLLKTLFLINFLPPWSGNLSKRMVKSPKIYLNDTALQFFLLNIDLDRLNTDQYLSGSIIENFVILELFKQISWSNLNIQMHYYRDYNQCEVDVVLEGSNGDLVAMEIKSGQTITNNDFKNLKKFQNYVGDKFIQGIVLYTGDTFLPFGEKLTACPISSLWG